MNSVIIPLIFSLIVAVGGTYLIIIAETSGYKIPLFIILSIPVTGAFFFSIPHIFKKVKNLILNLKWFHILWALYLISGQTFRLRTTKSAVENPLDKAAIFRVLLVSLVGISLMLAFAFRRNLQLDRIFGGVIKWLFIFSIICILSTLWSCYPLWTLYKSVEYFIGVFLASFIVYELRTEKEFKHFFDWTIFLYSLLMLSVWIGVVWKPNMAIRHGVGLLNIQIKGYFPKMETNGVGHVSALVGLVSFVRLMLYNVDRKFYFVVFLVSTVTLIFSQSRSPLTGFLLGIVLILFISKKIKGFVFLILILVITIISNFWDIFIEFFMRGQTKELFMSLSGRIAGWKAAFSLFKENPILGYGAYAAGRFFVGLKFKLACSSLLSDWIETLIGTGLLGFTFLFISFLVVWLTLLKTSIRNKNLFYQQLCLESLGILTLLTVRSFFSVPFIWHPANAWLLIVGFTQFLKTKDAYSARS